MDIIAIFDAFIAKNNDNVIQQLYYVFCLRLFKEKGAFMFELVLSEFVTKRLDGVVWCG